MSEQRVQLFRVEFKGRKGVTGGFVPAHSANEAIDQARAAASNIRLDYPDLYDPLQESGVEVRVGTFEPAGSARIQFGDWQSLPE